ncbi:putative MFS transporter [Aspergillus homomorphus CBS 101889]|uniref:Putative polyamine transporter n=1 Tax=Aspergillus homomorphus (strain CBS 101889) TaxID=1450537 RepID=A0A395HGT6_ASPHC|nr:putative polyamine transporter [Aspergillus homomorphus CBS 101889]RAL07121.1 putative polyamine transporter [Aspergillus homomorphus CBS 101889]
MARETVIPSLEEPKPSHTSKDDRIHVTETSTGGNHDEDAQLNPRHWHPWKKRFLFFALMSSSILADGGMTWGATLIVPQALDWDITVNQSATTMNYGMLLQGVGGLMAIPLIEAYGRLPVWLWPQFITTFMVVGATLSNSFGVFTAFRSLQGLFGTVPQVVGLPIIHDMYSPEEWSQMINIWGTTFLVGPFLGPALAGYIGAGSNWKVSFGILAVLYGLSTVLIFLFGYETYYVRGRQCQQNSRLLSMFGVRNHNLAPGPTLLHWCKTLVVYIFKTPLLLTGIATMVNFCWPIGITVTVSTFVAEPPYLFNTVQSASLRWAAILGALLGWAYGYWFDSWVTRISAATYYTEKRLHGVWAAIITMACGLLTYGFTLNYGKHWIGLAFGWLLVVAGMVASTVSITAYALEKYPEQSTVVSAIINAWRTASGFSVGYFQPSWIERDGIAAVFGTQAAVVVVNMILTITPVIVMERCKYRQKPGLA